MTEATGILAQLNDKRVGTVVRDIGVMVLATGIIFVMQRAMN